MSDQQYINDQINKLWDKYFSLSDKLISEQYERKEADSTEIYKRENSDAELDYKIKLSSNRSNDSNFKLVEKQIALIMKHLHIHFSTDSNCLYIEPDDIQCSFCGKTKDQVEFLVSSNNGSHICNECIKVCQEIARDRDAKEKESPKKDDDK